MLKIKRANSNGDWLVAAQLLKSVVAHLIEIECPLWTAQQVSVAGLQSAYKVEELHFIVDSLENIIGVVFLQNSDPYFWPEIYVMDSLFVHKLAINPAYKGKNYGREIIGLIATEARRRQLQWIRLDCDDRQPLHRFYQRNGFKLVDIKPIQEFMVARYELAVNGEGDQ